MKLKVPTVFAEIDLTIPGFGLPPPKPFWMLTRWDTRAGDVCEAEREEAAAAGVTAVFDGGIGLTYDSEADAAKVAEAMAKRFGTLFGVYGGGDQPTLSAVFGPKQ